MVIPLFFPLLTVYPGIKGAGNVDNEAAFFPPYSEEQYLAYL